MSLAILFHFFQHVSDINISIIRSLRLFCWITTLVVLFLVRCVLECAEACNTDTTPTQPHRISNTHRTKNNTTNVVIQQNNRKLLMIDILMSVTCWAHKKWNKIASDIKLVFYSSAITMMQGPINIKYNLPPYQISRAHVQWPIITTKRKKERLQLATRIPLQPNHTENPTHIEPRTIRPMW